MKTVGLIVEYNPLHNGHVYHYQQSKIVSGADAAVAVMSGNFLQRGEPALVNKWARTEMALAMGVDLVIELPVAYASQPAEWFAFGAVSALDATGVVDSVCFGSESGEIGWLQELAGRMHREADEFPQLLRQQLKTGVSYPAAYSKAVEQYAKNVPEGQLAKPNNILGLHYLIALERLNSRVEPLTITRQKAEYHQQSITDRKIASATALRRLLFEHGVPAAAAEYVPEGTLKALAREWTAGRAPVSWASFFKPLMLQLLSRSDAELSELAEVTEGLEHRIKRVLPSISANDEEPIEQLFKLLKTKRYTRVKLQRTLLRILLNHRKEQLSRQVLGQGVPYLRVLGFSVKGQELLKQMKRTAKVPVVMKAAEHSYPLLELDIRASSVYALAYARTSSDEMFRDYYQSPIRAFPPDGS